MDDAKGGCVFPYNWKIIALVLSVVYLVGAITWLATQPHYEPLLVVVGGAITLLDILATFPVLARFANPANEGLAGAGTDSGEAVDGGMGDPSKEQAHFFLKKKLEKLMVRESFGAISYRFDIFQLKGSDTTKRFTGYRVLRVSGEVVVGNELVAPVGVGLERKGWIVDVPEKRGASDEEVDLSFWVEFTQNAKSLKSDDVQRRLASELAKKMVDAYEVLEFPYSDLFTNVKDLNKLGPFGWFMIFIFVLFFLYMLHVLGQG